MNFETAVNLVHNDLTKGITFPYYFRYDAAPVQSLKYINPQDNTSIIWVLPDVCTSRIVWSEYNKSGGVVIVRKTGDHWYVDGETKKIPKIDAAPDVWFNFSVQYNLTKDTYQKYLDIIDHSSVLDGF